MKKLASANLINMRKFLATAITLILLTQPALASVTYYSTDEGCSHPFIDIVDHWAEEEVCTLYSQNVVEGNSERNFDPNNYITRAEFLKISLLHLGYRVYSVQSAEFDDIEPGDWYYQYITFARSKGFVNGYEDGGFHPNDYITRGEAIVMIMNIAGISTYNASYSTIRFHDVWTNDWFANAVGLATDYGIIQGYTDNTFRPYDNIRRAEAAVVARNTWNYLY